MREQLAEMTETANKFLQLWDEQSRAIAVVIAEVEAIKSRKGTETMTNINITPPSLITWQGWKSRDEIVTKPPPAEPPQPAQPTMNLLEDAPTTTGAGWRGWKSR